MSEKHLESEMSDKKYILAIDQSTQATKALIYDRKGALMIQTGVRHRQIIDERGWISHDPVEIYKNMMEAVKKALFETDIPAEEIAAIGITNQRETSVVWNRKTGEPVANAIVWQCSRAKNISDRLFQAGWAEEIKLRSGLALSPYFPASKYAWILENTPGAKQLAENHELCFGTIECWLLYCLTGGSVYASDVSNAARTQLLNLKTLKWDERLCELFGICAEDLPEVMDCDAYFGDTTMNGISETPIPIHGMMGDSNGALFGQGCLKPGMTKTTYGTGSSVMMNAAEELKIFNSGIVTSVAWKYKGRTSYCLEGNINYSSATTNWLRDHVGLFQDFNELSELLKKADLNDDTCLVPAFSGLGAPYFDSEATALITGMNYKTGKAEIAKAGLESIAFQIRDIVVLMEKESGIRVSEIRADGGACANSYLMQFQSDIGNIRVSVADLEDLSAFGVACMAGIGIGLYEEEQVFRMVHRKDYNSCMDEDTRARKQSNWSRAISQALCRKI